MEFSDEPNNSFTLASAWAATVYSLVPFLGILFVPVSLLLGLKDVILGGEVRRRAALNVLAVSLAVLTVQTLLWWLLYIVPTLNG